MKPRFFLALTLMLAGCSSATSVGTTAGSVETTATSVETTARPVAPTAAESTGGDPVIPEVLADFTVETIQLDGVELLVAVADTGALRRQGLMNVADIGGLDGMLFVFDRDSSGGFWMKNTLIPLDIAFFDADGAYVDGFAMEPCTTANCPTYRPGGSYRYALEMPTGDMPGNVQTLER